MFDRFSENPRMIMALSRRTAVRLGHDYIGAEHILLAMTEFDGAAGMFEKLQVDPVKLKEDIEKRVAPGDAAVSMGQIPFTPQAKAVLEETAALAGDLGVEGIDSLHLLLALLRIDGIAKAVLEEAGLDYETARERLGLPRDESVRELPRGDRTMLEVLDQFDDDARRVLTYARAAALRLRHEFIHTEHILLALLELEQDVIRKLELDPRQLQEEIERRTGRGTVEIERGQLPFTPDVALLLMAIPAVLSELGDATVHARHLVLAMLRASEPPSIGRTVLEEAGLDYDTARSRLSAP